MLQALRELEGGIQLSLNVAARAPRLAVRPIFESFLRQVYFTGVTAATGVVLRACALGPLVIEASFTELTGRLFELYTPVDFYYSVVKSLLFGFAIAACCCWHGLNPPDLTQNAVPKVVTRAVMQSAMLVLLINAVFAYVVFGILFFGLVKAPV